MMEFIHLFDERNGLLISSEDFTQLAYFKRDGKDNFYAMESRLTPYPHIWFGNIVTTDTEFIKYVIDTFKGCKVIRNYMDLQISL